MSSPHSIVVRMPNWIGDLVMATPVLLDLRAAFPDASLTAMCRASLSELLRQEPCIDELFSFERPQSSFLRRQEQRNIIAKLEGGSHDVGLLLTNSFSSAWWFWQAKVRRRIGYKGHFRSLLLTDALLVPNEPLHQVELYKKLLEPLGIPRSPTSPRLVLADEEREDALRRLLQRGYTPNKPLVGVHPGAAFGSAKCWLPERFRELGGRLAEEGNCVAFFGDVAGAALVKEICQGLPDAVLNLSAETSLRELAALIARCDLFLSNDSGPMHIAAALGTPLIALFGSTDDQRTGPYGQSEAVIHKRVSCSPCFRRTCPIDFRCMTQISVEEVLERARSSLKRNRRV